MMPTASAQKVNSNNTWNTPYFFNSCASREQYQTCLDIAEAQPTIISDNAKEYDEETGMYYYGARYYEPRLSLWMSTDPMQEKAPNVSTYIICHNNTINRIDLLGLTDYFNENGSFVKTVDENKNDRVIVFVSSKNKRKLMMQ